MVWMLLACFSRNADVKQGLAYAGQWQDEGGGLTTIELVDRAPLVTGISASDGEVMEMRGTTWRGGTLAWSYHVPSTDYNVHITATSLEGDRMCTTWANDYDSGEECYDRLD